MLIMNEETLCVACTVALLGLSRAHSGPAVGIMKVQSDEEALKLINDSIYGLTCSVWTKDEAKFEELLPDIEAGTVYLNRCDYCDPALAWTGRKDSGRGYSLSTFGFDAVTQLKSVNKKLL
jgi:acyl-CoA reductase-like NAD-dependent aldehyde dehydrogenase